jgi:hypothetical protein
VLKLSIDSGGLNKKIDNGRHGDESEELLGGIWRCQDVAVVSDELNISNFDDHFCVFSAGSCKLQFLLIFILSNFKHKKIDLN